MIKPSYEIRSDRDSDFNSFGNTFGGSCYLKGTVFQMCLMWFQKNKNFEAFFFKKNYKLRNTYAVESNEPSKRTEQGRWGEVLKHISSKSEKKVVLSSEERNLRPITPGIKLVVTIVCLWNVSFWVNGESYSMKSQKQESFRAVAFSSRIHEQFPLSTECNLFLNLE